MLLGRGTPDAAIVDPTAHWEKVYRTKKPEEVGWYRQHLDVSLSLIAEAAPGTEASIIDVGGGESTLLVKYVTELHRTPASAVQQFVYCSCKVA